MPSSVTVDIDAGLQRAMGDPELIQLAVRTGLEVGLQDWERNIKRDAPVKTGRLRQSVGYQMKDWNKGEIGSLFTVGGSPIKYFVIQDLGGVIKGNPYLCFPIGYSSQGFMGPTLGPRGQHPLGTPSGVGGIGASDLRTRSGPRGQKRSGSLGKSEFGIGRTFVVKSRRTSGNLVIMGDMGGGTYMPLFVLARQVTIKGTRFFTDNVEGEAARNSMVEALDYAISNAFAARAFTQSATVR